MKKAKRIMAFLLVIGMLIITPIVKAEENESSIIKDVYINYGEKDNTTFTQVYFVVKEDFIDNSLFVEFYDPSASEMPMVHSVQFSKVNIDNPATKEDYESGVAVSEAGTEKGAKLFYFDEKVLFKQKTIKIVASGETNEYIYNEELEYEVIDGQKGNLTLIKNDSYQKNTDMETYEKFMNEYGKKYPYISAYMGDEHKMVFAYNSTQKGDEDIYIPMGTIIFAGKTFDELMAEMDAIAKNQIATEIPESNKIESKDNILKALKDTKVSTTYESIKNNKLLYSWTFDGSKMTDEDTKLNINLEIKTVDTPNKEKIEALVPSSLASLKIDFKHSGALPTGTSIKLNVSEAFKNEDILDLYYYNAEKNTLEKVVENIVVVGGYVSFPITHCSEYVLVVNNEAKKNGENNVQTSSMNVILYTIISIVSASALSYILRNKSKEIA